MRPGLIICEIVQSASPTLDEDRKAPLVYSGARRKRCLDIPIGLTRMYSLQQNIGASRGSSLFIDKPYIKARLSDD